MKKTERPMSYEAAQAELEQIARDLQDERTSVDELAEKAKRAAELIEHCKKRLKAAEAEAQALFEKH